MPEFLRHYYIEKPVGAVLTAHGRMNSPPHPYDQLVEMATGLVGL